MSPCETNGVLWCRFVGGTMGGRAWPLRRWPRDGEAHTSPRGERYFYDPMLGAFVLRWPPLGREPLDQLDDESALVSALRS